MRANNKRCGKDWVRRQSISITRRSRGRSGSGRSGPSAIPWCARSNSFGSALRPELGCLSKRNLVGLAHTMVNASPASTPLCFLLRVKLVRVWAPEVLAPAVPKMLLAPLLVLVPLLPLVSKPPTMYPLKRSRAAEDACPRSLSISISATSALVIFLTNTKWTALAKNVSGSVDSRALNSLADWWRSFQESRAFAVAVVELVGPVTIAAV